MILIGSRAIKHHFPDFRRGFGPSATYIPDWDYVIHYDRESERPDDGIRHEFQNIPAITKRYGRGNGVLSPDHLYTLKMSHIFWPIKQQKHLSDIIFLRNKGCQLDQELFEELFLQWTSDYGPNTTIDFDMDNDQFFDDYVQRLHKHDDLHLIVNPSPLYLLAKENSEKANISENIFATLHKDVQMDIVREEGYVLALERVLLRKNCTTHWRVAYTKMLRHMICKLTPRWLGIFIAENYNELIKPKYNFHKKYKDDRTRIDCVVSR